MNKHKKECRMLFYGKTCIHMNYHPEPIPDCNNCEEYVVMTSRSKQGCLSRKVEELKTNKGEKNNENQI